jgi:hypothetical protein
MAPPEFRGFGGLEGAGGAADAGALGKAGEGIQGLGENGGGGVRSWEAMCRAEQRWGGRGGDATPVAIGAAINERGARVGGLRRE